MSRTHDVTISAFDLDRLEAELEAERSLADRLAEGFKDLWDNHTMYGAGYEVVEASLTAWKEARSERR